MRIRPDRGEREAIPEAVLGMIDQFSFHRIHAHVLEVFDFLFLLHTLNRNSRIMEHCRRLTLPLELKRKTGRELFS